MKKLTYLFLALTIVACSDDGNGNGGNGQTALLTVTYENQEVNLNTTLGMFDHDCYDFNTGESITNVPRLEGFDEENFDGYIDLIFNKNYSYEGTIASCQGSFFAWGVDYNEERYEIFEDIDERFQIDHIVSGNLVRYVYLDVNGRLSSVITSIGEGQGDTVEYFRFGDALFPCPE
jgi:hypothetical protein